MLPIKKTVPPPRHRAPAIAVEVRAPEIGIWFAALAGTIREGGIFLSTYEELPPGTRVEIEIGVPRGPSVIASGVVTEHPADGAGIHVAFADLGGEMRARFESLARVA